MPTPLTPKQTTLFNYLKKEINLHGRAPSLRQAASDLGVSHAAVAQLIRTLETKSILRREGRYGRTIHLLRTDPEFDNQGVVLGRQIPIIGKIAAGMPLYAQQEWAGHVVVDSDLYQFTPMFALRVTGDSMQQAGILDGDLVLCQARQFANNGEIIVALVHGEEATVKRFFLRKKQIELRPENPAYTVQKYKFDQVLIQGKVVGLHRGPEQF